MKNAAPVASSQPKRKSFVVVYRVGGTARFEWRRTVPVSTKEEALGMRESLVRAGYHALAPQDYTLSMSIGLPETFGPAKDEAAK